MRRNCGMAVPSVATINRILLVLFAMGLVLGATPALAQPTLVSASNSDDTTVLVTFSEPIETTTGNTTSNYFVFERDTPSIIITVSTASTSGTQVTLGLASALSSGTAYTVRVQNVENLSGQPIAAASSIDFIATGGALVTPIADIQANPAAFDGQTVTVEGIVYIPTDYRGSTVSGYIQDTSGKGINLFGTGMDVSALLTVGNRVQVTGTVEIFFSTIEITNPTDVTLIDSGLNRPAPAQLTTGAAANTQWEGTFIEVTGTIASQAVGGPGVNYTVNDGSGPIVVRVVDSLSAPAFSNGETITAGGAGGQFGADFQVNVGLTSDISASAPAELAVTGASAGSATSVLVEFNKNIDAGSAGDTGAYTVYPTASPGSPLSVTGVTPAAASVTLTVSSMTDGVGYTVEVQDVEDTGGNPIGSNNSATYTYSASSAIPIADIQANPAAFEGQTVTVEGIVYIPTDYRGSTVSGYIQDSSNRGINLFGNGMDVSALTTVGNRVQVTGTVEIYFDTVEITNPTDVTLIQSGLNRPAPAQLTTSAAANSQWEGTFIEVTGPIISQAVGGPGVNYTVNDGSGPIVVRVVDSLSAQSFSNGETITARGAGGLFSTDFQVNVGLASDIFAGQAEFNVTGASATDANTVRVNFSDNVNTSTGAVASNYSVYPASSPGSAVTPTNAMVGGSSVTLSLAASLTDGTQYTVAVSNVTSAGGDPLGSNTTAAFTYSSSNAIPIATIQANPSSFEGQEVTVEGIVYVPTDYRGSTISGYIQDSSDRGINIFGNGFDIPATQTVGNRVLVTGTIEIYFSTVEITNPTVVTLLESGLQRPAPAQLTTGAGANSQWEGTFIEVSGPITAQAVGGPGTNYTVNDGSGPIVVRVVDTLGAPSFANGQTITARGAGGAFQTDFQVNVGLSSDVFIGGGGPDLDPPVVTSASGASANSIRVNFNEALDSATAQTASNYRVFETASPTTTIAVNGASLAGVTVTLVLASDMGEGTSYTVEVSNVEDLAGNIIQAGENTATFIYSASNAIPIATIQNDPGSFEGQTVTVEGVVYIPTDYRGATTSGFIQDESNRGINLFGSGMNVSALTTVGNRVRVTGRVEIYFSTVEITNPTEVTLISSGSRPGPEQLSTGAGANPAWEGTFIECSGTISSQSVAGGATNIVLNDGSGAIVARVVDTLNAPSFSNGQTITARGAGGAFGADFQILVGVSSDIFEGSGGDITPPRVTRASLETGTTVLVDYNEQVNAGTAGTASNYSIFRTGNTSISVAVNSAEVVSNNRVRLSLAESISLSESWTVNVINVEDLSGNAIQPPGEFRELEALLTNEVALSGPPLTFLPRDGEEYPITINLTTEMANDGSAEVLLRIFDLSGVLVTTLYDSRIDSVQGVFSDNRAVFDWNGTDEFGQWVSAGAYIAHLTARTPGGDGADKAQIPVVVATRLDR